MKQLSRRAVLRGLGTAVALPALEAMAPFRAFASSAAPKPPLRTCFLFVPNGVNVPHWIPTAAGPLGELPFSLTPLDALKKDLLVLTGLAHHHGKANGDGPGDHARSAATFLTGQQAKKTNGADIKVGISVDQLAADRIGKATRFPSLELGCDKGAMAGNCDSGYSCAYSSTVSWSTPSTPVVKEINPRSVFTRLFGDPNQAASARERAKQAMYRRSVLDLVGEDAKDLEGKLSGADRAKLDEYLESVRQVEEQIQSVEKDAEKNIPKIDLPESTPRDIREHLKVMLDLLVLALQSDSTRIATMVFANEGSNRTFPFIEVREGHHSLSHHGKNPEKLEKIKKIDHFYVENLAYFLGRLKKIKEGDGTLLDHSMILYGCAIGDGNRHNHNDLPIVLAGKAGGALKTGRCVQYPKDTPLTNLFLSMLDRLGISEEKFGDSTGRLADLA